MDRLYVETSIVSYATSRPSRDVAIAGLQQQARDWWAHERNAFELVTSQLTSDEAGSGDPAVAADRLRLLRGPTRMNSLGSTKSSIEKASADC